LLLDEPTEGLQPSIIKELARTLNVLKGSQGFAMLVSEQVLSFAMEVADRFLILDKGEFAYEGLRAHVDTARIHAYLTV
jgi:urea transport system ATP-binding protein